MTDVVSAPSVNVARRLAEFADSMPEASAIVMPLRGREHGRRRYRTATFAEAADDSDAIARGLLALGVAPGTRLALLVKPSIDFVTLVFAMLKAGVVIILIDPGMGGRNALRCLAEAEPAGFIGPPLVQAVRRLLRRRFPQARWNVTVGRSWFGETSLDDVRRLGRTPHAGAMSLCRTTAADPAAIIFTTGSTGPPKGVLYRHGNFDRQVVEIRDAYGIGPGTVNLACFPLFGLFNAAMGVTTVIPDMDASRPARVDPANIVEAVHDWNVTQSFASPAVWKRVGEYCETHDVRLPTLRETYSAGAPVPPEIIERMVSCMADGGRMHTPYGATEALPIATISSSEILSETRRAWAAGKGTCVGRRFSGIEWRVIRIVDGPIPTIDQANELSTGEIGELIVRGPVVTDRYVTRVEANAAAKIADGSTFWHRMGDAGYLDEQGRFWFCGRVAHRVVTKSGTLYTDPIEGVFNQHGSVARSALVGVGPPGEQRPVVIVELAPHVRLKGGYSRLRMELLDIASRLPMTAAIDAVLFHPSFPVDIRHNSKIFREQLAAWAEKRLRIGRGSP